MELLKSLLFEMPESINPTSFGLDDERKNQRCARDFLQDKKREIIQTFSEHVHLYKIGKKFALVDEEEPHLYYYMQWKEIFHKFVNHKAASQIAVWRDKDRPKFANVASTIFFDCLLPEYDVVITDALQTPDGRTFWMRRVDDAYERGLNVYYLNLQQSAKDVHRELIKIETPEQFHKLNVEKNFWGDSSKFQTRKIIIASVQLS